MKKLSKEEADAVVHNINQGMILLHKAFWGMNGKVRVSVMDKMNKILMRVPILVEEEFYRQMPNGDWISKLQEARDGHPRTKL